MARHVWLAGAGMSLPSSFVAAALVGAARADMPPAAGLPGTMRQLYRGLAARPPEEALLLLAGSASLYAAAGSLPERVADVEWRLPAYRPEGDLPACSPAAAHYLERMIGQQDAAFLPELLAMLAESGRRAPDMLLPYLLDYGVKLPRRRPLLLPVLGERGRWLASLNPAWRYAIVALDDPKSLRGVWESDPPGRGALAHSVRLRDPAAARRLIETTWRSEPDVARRDMADALEQGLSMDDEPFLERVLDDRDSQVRRKAADLLASLPDSRLMKRMTAAAGSILAMNNAGLAPYFPGEITEAMVRDGVTRPATTLPTAGAAQHNAPRTSTDWSRLIIQTVGAIPLEHWAVRLGLEPEAIIAAAQAGKWPRTVLTAFATAALRQKDRRWAEALLAADDYGDRTGLLLAMLSPEECFARLARRVEMGHDAAVVVFMRRWPHAWDEPSGRMLLDFLARQCEVDPDTRLSSTLRFVLRQFAQRCPPSLHPYAVEALGGRTTNVAWQGSLRHFLSVLALRHEIRQAVRE